MGLYCVEEKGRKRAAEVKPLRVTRWIVPPHRGRMDEVARILREVVARGVAVCGSKLMLVIVSQQRGVGDVPRV